MTHTLKTIYQWFVSLLTAIGLMTIAGLVGLYCSGFFTWLSTKYPDGWLTPLLSALAFG
jgi:hypothetical protein